MTIGADSLTVELRAADAVALRRVQRDLERVSIPARFAAEDVQPGSKAAADLVPLLVVVVAGLAEARKLVQILATARTAQKPVIEVSTTAAGARRLTLTNADDEDVRQIIEGHFRESDGGA